MRHSKERILTVWIVRLSITRLILEMLIVAKLVSKCHRLL
jgi:hypothetical protein